jgi:DNA-binding NarL/FixJ family response regulator
MNYFEFTKKDYEHIVEECMLDEEYSKLLEYKIKGYSRVKIALELNVTEYTVDKMLQKLKKKIMRII